MAEKGRAEARNAKEIGEIPPPERPELVRLCERNFRLFCESYFPETFNMPWSDDHLKIIAKVEQVVLNGEQFGMAMPRGSGKTSICEAACVWALVYAHRRFVVLIGSDATSSEEMLSSIRREFESEDAEIGRDFKAVCYPFHRLERVMQRRLTHDGHPVTMSITADEIILPDIEGSAAGGGILRVAGITGRIRGMKYKRADGKSARPDLVILDDPQTDESARSPSQCAYREKLISGTVLGLAGPGKKIAALMPCTKIYVNDLASRLLDRNKHPQWQGETTKLVYAWPTSEKLWESYRQLRAEGMRSGDGVGRANAFYQTNREAMDLGSAVAWRERFKPDELSALQHAMNLRYDQGDAAFFAEYQNEPIDEYTTVDDLKVENLLERISGLDRGVVPLGCNRITAFIDVQQKLLYWSVVAWAEDFSGSIIDYGAWPDQGVSYYTAADARSTMQKAKPGSGLEGAIYNGLEKATEMLLLRDWMREDGTSMRIDRLGIDANWGKSTDIVYAFCRQSHFAALLTPAHGRYVGAASLPFEKWTKRTGETFGCHWIMTNSDKRAVRHVTTDVNWWKSFVAGRLITAVGDRGAVTLYGKKGQDHQMMADQLCSETRVTTEGRGRKVDEWKMKPNVRDNHWWDCLVGAAVMASITGAKLNEVIYERKPQGKVSFAQLQAAARGR